MCNGKGKKETDGSRLGCVSKYCSCYIDCMGGGSDTRMWFVCSIWVLKLIRKVKNFVSG